MAANAERAMLPLQSLLNPAPPNPIPPRLHQPTANPSPPITTTTMEIPAGPMDAFTAPRARLSKGASSLGKLKPQGPINFPPWQDLDPFSLQELQEFQVAPFGQIHQCCEHIPYNSAKKDFFEKTGRESIEAFRYEFLTPDDGCVYTVMWDYNVGLVRMTPFFKSQGYAKTKPSQMLDKNPGLRDISPSITGGSVAAQGYWMPYQCAKAICATFCYTIAPALIPLFGPDFPSMCTHPNAPCYQDMIIDQKIIVEATREAHRFRYHEMTHPVSNNGHVTSYSRLEHRNYQDFAEPHPTPDMRRHTSSWAPINKQQTFPQQLIQQHTTSNYPMTYRRPTIAPLNLPAPLPVYDPFHQADPFRNAISRAPEPRLDHGNPDNWTNKRRRPEYESEDDSYNQTAPSICPMRAESTANEKDLEDMRPENKNSANVEDYAAAEVLVCLQNERQTTSPPFEEASAQATPRSATIDARHKKKVRAKSF